MLLMQLGSWAWNGMNWVSSAYLIVTCVGLAAIVATLSLAGSHRRGLSVFVVSGSLALAALSSSFLIDQYSQSGISGGGPLFVAGVPLNLNAMYGLTALGCAAVAALALWSRKHSPG
jgi:hypothetical protein